tara:strand:+ start:292 stop:411 length:120 start_codon:yes stop_codon:yes gene_type:complete
MQFASRAIRWIAAPFFIDLHYDKPVFSFEFFGFGYGVTL